MSESLQKVTTALTGWKSSDEELHRVQKLVEAAMGSGAAPERVKSLTLQLADIRAQREKAYRLALASMQEHHDRTGENRK